MIKKTLLTILVVILVPQTVLGLDLGIQPRFKTGVQYYEYQQDAFQSPARDPRGIFPNMQSSFEYKDWLPYVGGGLTLFVDRFFIDFDVQHAFDGEDQTNTTQQNFLEGGGGGPFSTFSTGTVLNQNTVNDTRFDRTEWAISAGFTVFDDFVLFAGYKHAETNFNTNLSGTISGLQASTSAPLPFLTGTFTGNLEQRFKYDGPFVGASYNWRVNHGFLDGTLAFNFAAAFMDGTVDLKFRDVVAKTQIGVTVPIDLQNIGNNQGRGTFTGLRGDSTGYSFGVAWRGFTPVDGLTYSLGVNGYLYKFDSKDSATPDFSETQVRMNFSLAYAFSI